VFGPFQSCNHAYAAVVPAFLDAALAGRPIVVEGDGHQTRDFTDVGTVAALIADAVARRVTSPAPVNLAFGTRLSVLELAHLVEQLFDRPLEIVHTDARVGDIRDSQSDPTRLRELFPDIVPGELRDALRETLEWMRSTA
jgi:UDP-glucose 4-epimerase